MLKTQIYHPQLPKFYENFSQFFSFIQAASFAKNPLTLCGLSCIEISKLLLGDFMTKPPKNQINTKLTVNIVV